MVKKLILVVCGWLWSDEDEPWFLWSIGGDFACELIVMLESFEGSKALDGILMIV